MDRDKWLARVADTAVEIEARSMLLQPGAIFWDDPAMEGFAGVDADLDVGICWGQVTSAAVEWARDQLTPEGTLLAYLDNVSEMRPKLAGWQEEDALVYEPEVSFTPEMGEGISDVRWMKRPDVDAAPIEDPASRRELSTMVESRQMAGRFVDGRAVSICYNRWQTETRWDISIDTVPSYRRQGHAQAVIRWMAGELAKEGRQPVWGAVASNVASQRLAESLGFGPAGRLVVFSRD